MVATTNLHLKPPTTIKFLCSYGGKIIPRHPDGKLRYIGGETRVVAVDRSIPFSELMVKMGELCGCKVSVRCQLPREDLDALVSITSDEDLANLIEEYDHADPSLKIRAFLSLPKKPTLSLSPSSSSSSSFSSSSSSGCAVAGSSSSSGNTTPRYYCHHHSPRPLLKKVVVGSPHYGGGYYVNPGGSRVHLVHHGNHWQ